MGKGHFLMPVKIRGARTHNLKNLDVDIHLNAITCICGPSGSGKTSLAFHTLLTESRRRLINSFPTDIKFFWDIPHTVDVDRIEPVLPAWGLPQSNPVIGSRPCVIDLLGLTEEFSRIFYWDGAYICPKHEVTLKPESFASSFERLLSRLQENEPVHVVVEKSLYQEFYGLDFLPSRSLSDALEISSFNSTDPYYEILRFKSKNSRIALNKLKEIPKKILDSIFLFIPSEKSLRSLKVSRVERCSTCGFSYSFDLTSEVHLSPHNALGACDKCQGYGLNLVYDEDKLVKDPSISLKEGAVSFLNYKRFHYLFEDFLEEASSEGFNIDQPFHELNQKEIWNFLYQGKRSYPGFNSLFKYLDSKKYKSSVRIFIRSLQKEQICEACEGSRYAPHAKARSLVLDQEFLQLGDLVLLSLEDTYHELLLWSKSLNLSFYGKSSFERILNKLKIACDMGLGHLSLSRKVKTLSAGEYQRILLNKFLSFEGSGSLFIFDEPSLGLDLDAQKVMMKYLRDLKNQENTILLIDHSKFVQSLSDQVIKMGPKAGFEGGKILYQGKFEKQNGANWEGHKYKLDSKSNLNTYKVMDRDRREIRFNMPEEGIVWVKGKSGVGKTSSIIEGLGNFYSRKLGLTGITDDELPCELLKGNLSKRDVLYISAQATRFSSRSTVGTYLGISPYLRKHYTKTPLARSLALRDGHFSPNSDLGKCSTCDGRGIQSIDMSFLEDVEFVCDDCKGMKLKPLYAEIDDGKRSFYEASNAPLSTLFDQIDLTPKLRRTKELVIRLNLDYLSCDRSLSSLSGGEKQRLKLLSQLQQGVRECVILFENISFGLSENELFGLFDLLVDLAFMDNLVVVIDQHELFGQLANAVLTIKRDQGKIKTTLS